MKHILRSLADVKYRKTRSLAKHQSAATREKLKRDFEFQCWESFDARALPHRNRPTLAKLEAPFLTGVSNSSLESMTNYYGSPDQTYQKASFGTAKRLASFYSSPWKISRDRHTKLLINKPRLW